MNELKAIFKLTIFGMVSRQLYLYTDGKSQCMDINLVGETITASDTDVKLIGKQLIGYKFIDQKVAYPEVFILTDKECYLVNHMGEVTAYEEHGMENLHALHDVKLVGVGELYTMVMTDQGMLLLNGLRTLCVPIKSSLDKEVRILGELDYGTRYVDIALSVNGVKMVCRVQRDDGHIVNIEFDNKNMGGV